MTHFHLVAGPDTAPDYPIVRKIGPTDLKNALAKGVNDFLAIHDVLALPSSLIFLGMIYPIVCIYLITDGLPLLFPLMSGFALVGPAVAVGFYEVSRRRELGLEISQTQAFDVLRSPSIPAILTLGLLLMVLFLLWQAAAEALYQWLFGHAAPLFYIQFLQEVFTTSNGWTLILLGNAIGCVFAAVALSISVVSFPLLLDRDGGVVTAVQTSIRAVMANPVTMALWGLIIAASLVVGFLLLFVGLVYVVPILAHASWHLYRKVVQ